MESYFAVCSKLVHSILDALSIALKVPAPGLSATHTKSIFQLRLLHYPPMKVDDLRNNNQWRINAHSDFGTLTLLFQDNVGGLEIEDPHHPGKFQSAVPLDDTVLVNMGESDDTLVKRSMAIDDSSGGFASCIPIRKLER